MLILNLAKLSDGTVDSVKTGFKQQTQCSGAAAFLEGIATAFKASNLPFQSGLLLFKSCSGALLDRQRFSGLLHRLLAAG